MKKMLKWFAKYILAAINNNEVLCVKNADIVKEAPIMEKDSRSSWNKSL